MPSGAQRELISRQLWPLLEKREYPKTICPSEVARALTRDDLTQLGVAEWRDAMSSIREVVFSLREEGEVEVLQKGEVLDTHGGLEDVTGPIRIRKKQQ